MLNSDHVFGQVGIDHIDGRFFDDPFFYKNFAGGTMHSFDIECGLNRRLFVFHTTECSSFLSVCQWSVGWQWSLWKKI